MQPDQFTDIFHRARASAILRCDDQEVAGQAMEAAIRGGFGVVEFTLTIPGALELIEHFSARENLVVGAGTVMTTDEAHAAVCAGASFLVSPTVEEDVVAAATDLGVAAMPGAHTPAEMLRAHRAGAPLVKLFPAPAGGPLWLRSVLGPLPFLRVVPTNGVDADNAREWLDAGAWALGFTTSLFDPADLKAQAFDRIETRAKAILERVRAGCKGVAWP